MSDFLARYQQLRDAQPRISLVNFHHENSEYCNYCADNKNSYMLFGSEKNEDTLYGTWIYHGKDCIDCDFSYSCERCYECTDCTGCYNCNFCQDCENVTDSEYCYDCVGCSDCFGCVGLRHQKYMIFNEQHTPDTYHTRVSEWKQRGRGQIYKQYSALQRRIPRKFMHEKQSEHCSGDYVYTSKNTLISFDVRDLQDCLYMGSSIGCNDSVDCSNCYFGCEGNYEVMSAISIKNCYFCYGVYDSQDLLYCDQMWNCHDCIGCSTLKRKEYHILNKPYSKEEYFKKREHMLHELRSNRTFGTHLPSTYPNPLVYPLS